MTGGETGARVLAVDWGATSLGPIAAWPAALRTAVQLCLDARFPIALALGPDGLLVYNDALRPALGARHPDALGRPVFAALPGLRPALEPVLRRVRETGEPAEAEVGGFTLHVTAIRDDAGGVAGAFGALLEPPARTVERARLLAAEQRARTEAEAERAKLHALFMLAPAPICIMEGPDHVYTLANEPYLRMVDRGDLIGRRFRDAFPERVGLTLGRLDRIYATGETEELAEVPFRYARREPGVVEDAVLHAIYAPFRDAAGQVAGIMVVSLDVTDALVAHHATERARQAAEAMAATQRAVLEFQERFVAVLGHDLRNPLAAIDMAAGLLGQIAERAGDARSLRVIGRIRSSSQRMSRMVAQILDLTRSRIGGGLAIEPARTELGALLTSIVEELRVAHPARRIEVSCPEIPGRWDHDRLEQVFSNLIGNAVIHGRVDAPVTVTGAREGDTVRVEIHNDGPPIPEAARATLFKPFRRGDRDSRDARTAGLGLGLYISRELVVGHGGRLDVESTLEHGTTFRVTLPLEAIPHPEAASP
jgi:signal transduction histidine kinase